MIQDIKSLLLYSDREMPPAGIAYHEREDIIKDLNLSVIFRAAAQPVWKGGMSSAKQAEKEDVFVYETIKRIMLTPLQEAQEIKYRQAMVKEAVARPEFIDKLYKIGRSAGKVLVQNRQREKERRGEHGGELLGTFEFLCELVGYLEKIIEILREETFERESGFTDLRKRLDNVCSGEFFELLHKIMDDMDFYRGGGAVSFSLELGAGMKEADIRLLSMENSEALKKDVKWHQRLFGTGPKEKSKNKGKYRDVLLRTDEQVREAHEMEKAAFTFVLSYFRPLLDKLVEFFNVFEVQMAFYKGCANLWERVNIFGGYFCFPDVLDEEDKRFDFSDLYELEMSILTREVPVSNSITQKDCWLLVVTGANQGGKSTFLRSIGIAQIMMQSGMFVPATRFCGNLYQNIYTHFTRREDTTMNSGRLDEELKRMDRIVKTVTKDSMLLLNESFATTTEKEGSVIAMDIISALYECGITVGMVTHLLQFASDLYKKQPKHAAFLSAERKEDGTRTFHMICKEPENTSFGLDLYNEIIK